jgi:phosphoglycerate dehydrogenase-like enzyme
LSWWVIEQSFDRDIDANSVQDADVLIVRSRTKVNQALLQDSQIKFVGSTVAGLEHVDQDYLTANPAIATISPNSENIL